MVLGKVSTKEAEVVSRAETKLLASFKVLSITRDNGLEIAQPGKNVGAKNHGEGYYAAISAGLNFRL